MAREMKDSGVNMVGKIPYNWEMKPIKAIASYNDETMNEATDECFEFDYIDIGSVQYGKGITQYQRMKFRDAPSRARRLVRRNDIIVSTVRTYLKAVAKIDYNDLPQVASTGFVVVRAKETLPLFLYYALLSETFICAVESHSTGISYPAINASNVVKLKIPIPPVEEQRRISAFLDSKCAEIDGVLEKTRTSIEEYKKLKQAIITQAVTKGIRGDRPMKESGIEWIGEIPESWDVRRIKSIGLYRNGLTYAPQDQADENNGVLVLRSSNVQNGKLDFSDTVFVSCKIPEQLMVRKGDILICSRNGSRELIGKRAIIDSDINASFGAFMMIFRCKCPKYMYYLLNFNVFSVYLNTFLTTTINQLTGKNFGYMNVVFCPDAVEQAEIVSFLDRQCMDLEELISKKVQLINTLEAYKKSLIYEYVTGKKEV